MKLEKWCFSQSFTVVTLSFLFLACGSSSEENKPGSSGGTTTKTGGTQAGGASVNGGKTSSPTGGTSGGITAVAGATGTGGLKTGGSTEPSATGGSPALGGKTAQGGSTGNGGTTAMSGGSPAGGGTATGGSTATGGTPATGGGTANVKICPIPETLKEAAACNNKLIGAALASGQLGNGNYAAAAKEHNYATAENEMKWETIEGSKGNFNFGPGDAIVNFATQNGMKVKGHTLVWHSQLPGWVSGLSTEAEVRAVMLNHIKTVMTHYKGKIHAWDVVNEAWDTPNKNGDGTATLRKSVFFQKLGAGYIDEAFKAAKEADPNALLIYNDYSTEGMNDKSNAVYAMVKSMKERGIPIDGVGIQTHIGTPNDTPTAAEIKQNIDRLAALGLQVMLSEMDINGCDGYTSDSMAKLYYDIVKACVEQPLCTAITIWGISDSGSWLNYFGEAGCGGKSPTPLLWDNGYKKKPTYTSVIKALTGN